MKYSDFSKALLLHPGIVRIELLTDDLMDEIRDIEYSPLNISFAPVEPIGLVDVAEKNLRLLLFCSYEFPMFTDHFMTIIDSTGSVVGHDVLKNEKENYKDSGYIWLTDNLFFDVSLLTDHYLKIVIDSLPLRLEGLPDDIRPIVFYPCTATANHINERFKVKGKICSTVLIGVDGIEF